jgi:multidrug efflux pump subunit AcrA (membrane-fusion protein)
MEAGESLYQIDPATYQASYESAKGDLAKAQAAAKIAQLTLNRYQNCSAPSTSVNRITIPPGRCTAG